jgi:hypothetical protein
MRVEGATGGVDVPAACDEDPADAAGPVDAVSPDAPPAAPVDGDEATG